MEFDIYTALLCTKDDLKISHTLAHWILEKKKKNEVGTIVMPLQEETETHRGKEQGKDQDINSRCLVFNITLYCLSVS